MVETHPTKEALTPQNDELIALAFESTRNGTPIDWKYWSRVRPSLSQAARLAHSIDPIKWPGDTYEQGAIPSELRERIERLEQWLQQNWPFPSLGLGHLVRLLGDDYSTWRLKQAAAPEIVAMAQEAATLERQMSERRASGRYTLEEAASELADKSGLPAERWLETIVVAINSGELALRNPRNVSDNLPYPTPAPLRTFYDQADKEDINRWLEENQQWGAARLGEMTGKRHSNEKKWTDAELRKLLGDYLGGMTQEALGRKHNVERQRVSVLLKQARERFAPRKPTLADTGTKPRKITGRQY